MRILVTAASRHDATTEVAHGIATALERADIEVDERRPEDVGHLDGFDGVVLGSAIYAGDWLKPAKDLVERTSSRMRALPVWLFSTGPIGVPLKPEGLPVDVAPSPPHRGRPGHPNPDPRTSGEFIRGALREDRPPRVPRPRPDLRSSAPRASAPDVRRALRSGETTSGTELGRARR